MIIFNVFLSEVSFKIFVHVLLFTGYKSFIQYIIYNYFLPICSLQVYFLKTKFLILKSNLSFFKQGKPQKAYTKTHKRFRPEESGMK